MPSVSPFRRRLRTALSVATLAGVGLALAATTPAQADDDHQDVDLGVQMPVTAIVQGAAKTLQVQVDNHGTDPAANVVLTVDAGKVDSDQLKVSFPMHRGCTSSGTVWTCKLGKVGGSATVDVPVALRSTKHATVGSGGSITATVQTDSPDNFAGNDTRKFPITVEESGVDLVAYAAPQGTLKAGGTLPLEKLAIVNEGSSTADGVSFTVRPGGIGISIAEKYQECTWHAGAYTCKLTGVSLKPGYGIALTDDSGKPLLSLKADKHILGPSEWDGTFSTGTASGSAKSAAKRAGTSLAAKLGAASPRVRTHARSSQERVPADNSMDFTYRTAPNPYDLAVSAPAVRGKVGATVTVRATITNKGPADKSGFNVGANLPSGTSLVGTPVLTFNDFSGFLCQPRHNHGYDVYCRMLGEFPAKGMDGAEPAVLTFKLKINSADPGKDGKIVLLAGKQDSNKADNTAAIRIAMPGEPTPGTSASATPSVSASASGSAGGSGSLPTTGGKLGLIAGAGAVLLLGGAGALLLARRRRAARTNA